MLIRAFPLLISWRPWPCFSPPSSLPLTCDTRCIQLDSEWSFHCYQRTCRTLWGSIPCKAQIAASVLAWALCDVSHSAAIVCRPYFFAHSECCKPCRYRSYVRSNPTWLRGSTCGTDLEFCLDLRQGSLQRRRFDLPYQYRSTAIWEQQLRWRHLGTRKLFWYLPSSSATPTPW